MTVAREKGAYTGPMAPSRLTNRARTGVGVHPCDSTGEQLRLEQPHRLLPQCRRLNHERPRRGETFMTGKITSGVVRINEELDKCLFMGNLDSLRDRGQARADDAAGGVMRSIHVDAPNTDVASIPGISAEAQQGSDIDLCLDVPHPAAWPADRIFVACHRGIASNSSPKFAETLEPTQEWYATAKIAGIKLCEALLRQHGVAAISLLTQSSAKQWPTHRYGPDDNHRPQHCHVLPAWKPPSADGTPKKQLNTKQDGRAGLAGPHPPGRGPGRMAACFCNEKTIIQ